MVDTGNIFPDFILPRGAFLGKVQTDQSTASGVTGHSDAERKKDVEEKGWSGTKSKREKVYIRSVMLLNKK